MRAVEFILGISIPGTTAKPTATSWQSAVTSAASTSAAELFSSEVKAVLQDAIPILAQVAIELAVPAIFNFHGASFG